MGKNKYYRFLGQIIYIVFLAWVAWYFYNLLSSNWLTILENLKYVNYYLLTLSTLIFIIFIYTTGYLWGTLVNRLQTNFSPWQACLIDNIAQIGKYFPGKIWSYIGRWYIGRDYGLTKKSVLISIVNEFVLYIIAGLIVSLPALLPFIHNITIKIFYIILCIIGIIFYQSFFSLLTKIYKKFKKIDLKIPRLSHQTSIKYLIAYIVLWSVGGSSFYLTALSFHLSHWGVIHFINYNALFAVSYLVSYIVLFAPGGIGIREIIQNTYLPIIGITGYQSAVLAIFGRIISTLGDIIVYFTSSILLKKYKRLKE